MKQSTFLVGLIVLQVAMIGPARAQDQEYPAVRTQPMTGAKTPHYEFSQDERALSVAALNKLPPGAVPAARIAQLKERMFVGDTLLVRDITLLSLALSRYDTAESLALMHKVAP